MSACRGTRVRLLGEREDEPHVVRPAEVRARAVAKFAREDILVGVNVTTVATTMSIAQAEHHSWRKVRRLSSGGVTGTRVIELDRCTRPAGPSGRGEDQRRRSRHRRVHAHAATGRWRSWRPTWPLRPGTRLRL